MKNLPLLSDNAIHGTAGDHFGFVSHARVLCDALQGTDDLPLTVGIFGPWGMGKSSFMNVCRDLLREQNVPTIWFNPWKYDQKDEIWHALIQTVLTEIASDLEKRRAAGEEPWRDRMAEAPATVRRLSQAAAWLLARRATGPLTGGILAAEDVDRFQDALAAPNMQAYLHVNHFEEDFRDVVRSYTDGGRLVLFVIGDGESALCWLPTDVARLVRRGQSRAAGAPGAGTGAEHEARETAGRADP